MEIHELVIEMKLLERRLMLYEEKYGILSEDFYRALMAGELERYDEYDETRTDFSRWKGLYETWQRRRQAYETQIKQSKRLNRSSRRLTDAAPLLRTDATSIMGESAAAPPPSCFACGSASRPSPSRHAERSEASRAACEAEILRRYRASE